MERYLMLLLFISTNLYGQDYQKFDSLSSVYKADRYLFEKFHTYKKDEGFLNGMIAEISTINNISTQQYALIALYDQSYGFKWVNKKELAFLIDSVISSSVTDKIKQKAIEVKNLREQGLIGMEIPSINLVDANGELININSIDTEYIIIDLWATWCKPCLVDMKKIPELRSKYNNIEFFSISFDKDYSKMVKFIKKTDYHWPIVFAGEDHELWQTFRIKALPQYLILNKDRIIIKQLTANLSEELESL